MPQFNRLCSVIIGIPGQQGKRHSGLRVRFSVERDLKASSNTAKVDIYNLSEDSRAAIKEHLSTFTLYAGYAEDSGESILFTHDVDSVTHKVTAPEIVTTIETGDGRKATRESRVSLSLEPGCNVGDVCKVIAERMQLPIKEIPQVSQQFSSGFSFVGPAEDALRRVSAAGNLEHSVQDGQLVFLSRGKSSTKESVFLIGPESGLIDVPERITQPNEKLKSNVPQSQWSFRALLNPQLTPGRRIQLQSRIVSGVFRLDAVRHVGDTHGEEWFSECEVSIERA